MQKDETKQIGDIVLDLNHWDCECNETYIHPKKITQCKICGSLQEESPNSRQEEVDRKGIENNEN